MLLLCLITGRIFMVKKQDNLTDFILGDNETIVSVIAGERISMNPGAVHYTVSFLSTKMCFNKAKRVSQNYLFVFTIAL